MILLRPLGKNSLIESKKLIKKILKNKKISTGKQTFTNKQLQVIANANNCKKDPLNYILKSVPYSYIEKDIFQTKLLSNAKFFTYKAVLPIIFWNLMQDNVKLAAKYEDNFFVE